MPFIDITRSRDFKKIINFIKGVDTMKIYGDISTLSKTKMKEIKSYYVKLNKLNMGLSASIRVDGIIYNIKYKGNTFEIEDDILYGLIGNNGINKNLRDERMITYMEVKSGEIDNVNQFSKEALYLLISSTKLYNIFDEKIKCKSYKEYAKYLQEHCLYKARKTYDIINTEMITDIYNEPCVYRFLDKDNNIIYVGKTQNISNRMTQHFSGNGHLLMECYRQVKKIQYIQCENEADMSIKEIYFINKFKPKYNNIGLYDGDVYNKDYDSIKWNNEYPVLFN